MWLRRQDVARAPPPPPLLLLLLATLCGSGLAKHDNDTSAALGEIRLEGGSSRCSGLLQVKRQRGWTEVLDHNWDLTFAAAVCTRLDCGSVVHTMSTSAATPWRITPTCLGSQPVMRRCLRKRATNSVKITCSDSVRLVNGTSLCSGALKVKSNQSWSSACEDKFHLQDAEVVCRELGCEAPSLVWAGLDAGGEETPWAEVFHCVGNESALLDCDSSTAGNTCSSGRAVRLTCSEPDSVRLVGGSSRCAGELEVKQQAEWSKVDVPASEWSLKAADEVCRQLDCGAAVSTGRKKTYSSRTTSMGTACVRSQAALRECVFTKYRTSDTNLEINCSDSVRLLGGSSRCSGRLQVKSSQVWSSVCEGAFDLQDAAVACGELGCGSPLALRGVIYRVVGAPVWSGGFHCEGGESALLDCGSSPSPGDTCSSGKSVVLTCAEPHEVQLVGGSGRCSGEPEIKLGGGWRRVTGGQWDLMSAAVVCRQLDCGAALSAETTDGSCDAGSLATSSACGRSDTSVRECASTWPDYVCNRVEINCSESVRLVQGTSWCSGRLEVKNRNRSWSSVCEADFDQRGAEVACRELGCEAPVVFAGGLHGDAEAPVWSRGFRCQGNESALLECGPSGSARDACSPGEAVGLTCSEPDSVRLFGGSTRCDGTLHMKGRGQWRPVLDKGFDWSRTVASAACPQLGCGFALSTNLKKKQWNTPMWSLRHPCGQSDDLLWECLLPHHSSSTLEIICSGILAQPNISCSASDDEVSVEQQELWLLLGSSFAVSCRIRPQFPGGSFQLTLTSSDRSQNYTLPAVNHAAHFLFSAADHTLQGEYRCVYHIYVFHHRLSSESRRLHLTFAASLTDLIIRVVLVTLMLFSSSLFFYCKASRGSSELRHLGAEEKLGEGGRTY